MASTDWEPPPTLHPMVRRNAICTEPWHLWFNRIETFIDATTGASTLDFAGDTGTGEVDLNDDTFTLAGTTNEIETTASGGTITIGLPDDVTITGTLNLGLTEGSVVFAGASGLTEDNANFFWDDTNNRLGLGTATPVSAMEVNAGAATLTVTSTSPESDAELHLISSSPHNWRIKSLGVPTGTLDINYSTTNVLKLTTDRMTIVPGEIKVLDGTYFSNDTTEEVLSFYNSYTYMGAPVGIGDSPGNAGLYVENAILTTDINDSDTYTVKIAPSGTVYMTFGADATYGYIQTWEGTDLYLQPSTGDVYVGDDLYVTGYARVSRLEIDGDTTYLDTDGSTNMTFTDAVTGTKTLAELATVGAPAGNDHEVQFNDNGSFGASTNLQHDGTNTYIKSDMKLYFDN